MYQHILVALDGSSLAEQVLPHAVAHAEKFGSSMTLIRAIMPHGAITALVEPSLAGTPMDPELVEATLESQVDQAQDYLEAVAGPLREQGLTVATACPAGPAVDVILDLASTWPADLIALTTHGRSGLSRLVHGSVAEGVLRAAACPVLLVRTHAHAGS